MPFVVGDATSRVGREVGNAIDYVEKQQIQAIRFGNGIPEIRVPGDALLSAG